MINCFSKLKHQKISYKNFNQCLQKHMYSEKWYFNCLNILDSKIEKKKYILKMNFLFKIRSIYFL